MSMRSSNYGSMKIYGNKLSKYLKFKMQFTLKNMDFKIKYKSEYTYLLLSLIEHMFPFKFSKDLSFTMHSRIKYF